jgi:Rnl2 family RNA ligase
MEFKKYSEIENTYRSKTIQQIEMEGKSGGHWYITLKVHGSNFAVYMSPDGMKCAKRSGFIGENNPFFNHDYVLDKQLTHLQMIYSDIRKSSSYTEVIFYGEIFGGLYPHPDVEKVKNQTVVQKGVYYSPENKFIIFDIKCDGKFLAYDMVCHLCEQHGMLHAKPLFIGSFEECLKYPNEFADPLCKEFGLPEIEGNICEGVVIKPNDTRYFNDGTRIILKNKNEKFKENAGGVKVDKETKEVNPEIIAKAQKILDYCNDNRLNAVLSKIGTVTNKDFGKLLGMVSQDMHADFIKDHESFYEGMENVEKREINKLVNSGVSTFLRKQFLDIMDRNK